MIHPVFSSRCRAVLWEMRHDPQCLQLRRATELCRAILEGRRDHQVCPYSVYRTLGNILQAIFEAMPERAFPMAAEHELEAPPPAWSMAESLHAKAQGKHRIANAHLIVACRSLGLERTSIYQGDRYDRG